MSWGAPKWPSICDPSLVSSAAAASSSTGSRRRSAGTSASAVPSAAYAVITALSDVLRSSTRPSALASTRSSVFTVPPTTDSPSPQAAEITASWRRPLVGFAVNSTPAASASTISCTTTARLTVDGSMPWRSR